MRWKGACRLSCNTAGLRGFPANGLDKGLRVRAARSRNCGVQAKGRLICSDFRTSLDHSSTVHEAEPQGLAIQIAINHTTARLQA